MLKIAFVVLRISVMKVINFLINFPAKRKIRISKRKGTATETSELHSIEKKSNVTFPLIAVCFKITCFFLALLHCHFLVTTSTWVKLNLVSLGVCLLQILLGSLLAKQINTFYSKNLSDLEKF